MSSQLRSRPNFLPPDYSLVHTPQHQYSLPIAVVTKDHKLSGPKQHRFVVLSFSRSEVQNWSSGLYSFGRPGAESVSSPFQASRGSLRPSARGPFPMAKPAAWLLERPPTHVLLPPPSLIRTLVIILRHPDNPESSPHLKVLNLISPSQSHPFAVEGHMVTGSKK